MDTKFLLMKKFQLQQINKNLILQKINFCLIVSLGIFFYLKYTKVQQENIGRASFEKNKRFLTPKNKKKMF